jgi:hypothetical protein
MILDISFSMKTHPFSKLYAYSIPDKCMELSVVAKALSHRNKPRTNGWLDQTRGKVKLPKDRNANRR